MGMNIAGGKGSQLRPTLVPKEQFESNWDKIFGKKEIPQGQNSNEVVAIPDKDVKQDESVQHHPV